MSTEKIINLADRRRRKDDSRATLELIGKVANTGTKPFLALASDDNYYWCKRLHNDHLWQSTVNEIAASIIGGSLGAPVREWKIIDVPKSLHGYYVRDGNYRLDGTPLFGSKVLHNADLDTDPRVFKFIRDDGNYNRIPLLIALHILCNAKDIQIMYDPSGDNSIWSIDHGMWFGSDEFPWTLQTEATIYGRTEVPSLPVPIESHHWEQAITAVEKLATDLGSTMKDVIPAEWEISSSDTDRLIDYVYNRQTYTIDRLQELKRSHRRR